MSIIKKVRLNLTIETDIEEIIEIERVVRAALDQAPAVPYIDFFDLEFDNIEEEEAQHGN